MTKKRLRIVDMCKYIDDNAYKKDADINLIYVYISTIYKSLAFNQRMFQDVSQYEPFGHYAATRMLLRLTNERQFLPESDPKKLEKVVSILNFIKSTLVPYKLMFLQHETLMIDTMEKEDIIYSGHNTCGISEYDSCYNGLLNIDVKTYLTQLKPLIWEIIEMTPYYSDIKMRHNLYISCLLTLVRSVTINNKDLYRFSNRLSNSTYSFTDNAFETLFNKEWETAPVVWNLPKEFKDYVKILVIKIKNRIMDSLKDLVGYYALNEDLVSDVLMTFIKDTCANNFNKETIR